MPLSNYKQVQDFINNVLTQNNELGGVSNSPHLAFWSTMSYNDFVNGNVPGVTDPNTNKPIAILIKGDSAHSNIILSLLGQGPLFDPNTGSIGQMPADGPPMFTTAQVKEIADWIDAGCPE